MAEQEKRKEAKIKASSDNKFLLWLENFWYHYKWPTLGIAFAIIVFGVCTWQMAEKEEYDISIIYAGPTQFVTDIDDVVAGVLPYDYTGDGENKVSIGAYLIFSDEQIEELEAETDSEKKPLYRIDKSFNANEKKNYNSDMSTGHASVCFLDPWLYEEFITYNKSHLCPLSEIFGENIPDSAIDGYGIRLGDTEIYKSFKALQRLPADTVICLETAFLTEKVSKDGEKKFEYEKEVFAAIVNYAPEEESDTVEALLPKRTEDLLDI